MIKRFHWYDHHDDRGDDVLYLNINDNQDGVLIDFINQQFKPPSDVSKYPVYTKSYNIFSDFFNVDTKNILLTQGSEQGLNLIIQSKTGVDAAFVQPTFGMFDIYSTVHRHEKHVLNYVFTDDRFVREIPPDLHGSMIYMPSPDNFTGHVMPTDTILNLCKNNIVVLDCAYMKIHDVAAFARLLEQTENLYIIHTMSKYYAGAGLRLGVILSTQKNIENVSQYKPMCDVCCSACDYIEFVQDNYCMYEESFDRITRSKNRMDGMFDGVYTVKTECDFFSVFHADQKLLQHLHNKQIVCREFHVQNQQFIRVTTPDIDRVEDIIC